MATSPFNPPGKQSAATLPPKRGRVKAQIFESLAETVSHVASKAGEALYKIRGGGGGGAGAAASDGSTSTTTGSPASAYASDGYGDTA